MGPTSRAILPSIALGLAMATLAACRDEPPHKPRASPAPAHRSAAALPSADAAAPGNNAPFEVHWKPETGKGDVVVRLAGGDRIRVCFHCGFEGYTGGLIVGSYDGSGFGFYPRRPIRGYRAVNVFCAQDESIWDLDQSREYSYGWSENFGRGDDGARLDYVSGKVVEAGPERVILVSENAGGCYRVQKVASLTEPAPRVVLATRITNRCDHPVHFDLFSGDDPWVGTYRSSDGDVGWTPEGLVRHEKAFGAGTFREGGLYDLGNTALGQTEQGFSNQANFMVLDPAVPLPDLAAFANGFAHRSSEVDPTRPLDNKTPTALNLGWLDRRLAAGQSLTVAMALGLADTGAPGSIPKLPAIGDEQWSVWRGVLGPEPGKPTREPIDFSAERVELSLGPHELDVLGTYALVNHGRAATGLLIHFPILAGPDRPAPEVVLVDGRSVPVRGRADGRHEAVFPVSLAPESLKTFTVGYRQRHLGRRAVYVVTSALKWQSPIARAVFVIRSPRSMGKVTPSYRPDHVTESPVRIEQVIVRQPFVPDRELELSW